MPTRKNVFVSSTSRDLVTYRDAVTKVILRLGLYPIVMEAFNPTDRNALQLCYDKVQESEIFIGIYAHRYGYAPSADVTYRTHDGTLKKAGGEQSITHMEYLWAVERGIPILLFVVSENGADGSPLPWPLPYIEDEPGKSRLRKFKDVILSSHVVGFFFSPEDLASRVATALSDILNAKNPEIKIDSALLAILELYKDVCRQKNQPFHTPSILLALLAIKNGIASRAFEDLESGLARFISDKLQDYVNHSLPSFGGNFIDFDWMDRTELRKALVIATNIGGSMVSEKSLLLSVLGTESNTVLALKKLLGGEKFAKLVSIVESMSEEPASHPKGTPGINFD